MAIDTANVEIAGRAFSDCFRSLPIVSLKAFCRSDYRDGVGQEKGLSSEQLTATEAVNLPLPPVFNLRLHQPQVNGSDTLLRLSKIVDQDAYLSWCKHPAVRSESRSQQFVYHLPVSLNQVTQVRHGRLSIGRVWEKQFRQLPFGVGANSEGRIVHLKIRFVVNTQFTFYHPDDAVKVA